MKKSAVVKEKLDTQDEIWIDVGELHDIPRLGSRVVKLASGDIAVFRSSDDLLFAIRDLCPHRGGPLSQGIMFDRRVACPLHDWVIDLETGEAQGPDVGCVATYPVRLENGSVFLLVNNDD